MFDMYLNEIALKANNVPNYKCYIFSEDSLLLVDSNIDSIPEIIHDIFKNFNFMYHKTSTYQHLGIYGTKNISPPIQYICRLKEDYKKEIIRANNLKELMNNI